MNTAKIPHISLTKKDGYVFRKRYQDGTFYLALRTKEEQQAMQRGAAVSIRYFELEALNLPYEAVYLSLKQYRDEAVRNEQIALLQRVHNMGNTSTFSFNVEQPVSAPVIEAVQPVTFAEQMAATAIQQHLESDISHSLLDVKAQWIKANTEWKLKTLKGNTAAVDKFITWAITKGLSTVEAIKKTHITDFKAWMDGEERTPQYKNKLLTINGGMFKFCIDVLDVDVKNPFSGMEYKNTATVNKKEDITKEQFEQVEE
ncbi:TPA: hypothetical protein ACW7QF_001905 [Klebsiella aerogenes]|uniref:hypothetical protein n=1 Tax=Klebsiella TaxID=570 RepID=UPI0029279E93|nr:hypothetical protein [Klebsiella sp. 141203]MDU9363216.1 hypothetical protein [Klebsiella sp. 141203]HEP0588680.1 hypothetical protein [Klebsiella aerogenes]